MNKNEEQRIWGRGEEKNSEVNNNVNQDSRMDIEEKCAK
jgi:hypothetical protein